MILRIPSLLLALVFAVASVCAVPSYAQKPSTWKDPKTGLTWQRCSLGQKWTGHDCDGTPRKYTFDQAQEAVKTLGNGWRVPAASELASLVRCNTGFRKTGELPDRKGGIKTVPIWCTSYPTYPTIDTTIFPNTPAWYYWSASSDANSHGYPGAWYVRFDDGYSRHAAKNANYHVRAVRVGQ